MSRSILLESFVNSDGLRELKMLDRDFETPVDTNDFTGDNQVIRSDTISGPQDIQGSGVTLSDDNKMAGLVEVCSEKVLIKESGGDDKITIQSPALAAPYTLTLPVDDGTPSQVLETDGSGVLSWATSGVGDVTASSNLTDVTLVQGDGGAKGVKSTTITVANNDELNSVQEVNLLVDGSNNTWYGFGTKPTIGLRTTRLGENAAGSMTSGGNDLVAIGYNAQGAMTNHGADITIGSFANKDQTTSGQSAGSVVIGKNALGGNFQHSENVLIGWTVADEVSGAVTQSIGLGAITLHSMGSVDKTVAIGNTTLVGVGGGNMSKVIAIGGQILETAGTVSDSIIIGHEALPFQTPFQTMAKNIIIGTASANNYDTTESNNIIIGDSVAGTALENQVIRIGNAQTSCHIKGIHGVTPTGAAQTVIIDSTGELGSTAAAGSGNVSSVNSPYVVDRVAVFDNIGGTLIDDRLVQISTANVISGVASIDLTVDALNNTKYGFQALDSVTTGNRNVMMGESAGGSQTTGDDNVVIGYQAGLDLIGARDCTLIGTSAGSNLLSGNSNTAIGSSALLTATNGSDNVAIGFEAMKLSTNTNECVAVGHRACEKLVTGQPNGTIGIGSDALRNLTNGSGNTAVGFDALLNVDTTDQNTALGFQAGVSTTGSNNTLLGYFSGNTFATGSGNIALGSMAGSSWTLTDSDNICISNVGVSGDVGEIRVGTPGTHLKSFQAGIVGVTPDNNDAIPMFISSVGQLATVGITPLPTGYGFGFAQVNTSTTVMTFGDTGRTSKARSLDDTFNLEFTGELTITTSVTGILGISDTYDPVVSNQGYDVYCIGDSTLVNATTIIAVNTGTDIAVAEEFLTSAYNKSRFIGWFVTQDGAATIIPHTVGGRGLVRQFHYTGNRDDQTILFGGSSTTFIDATDGGNGSDHYTSPFSTTMVCRIAFGASAGVNEQLAFRENGSTNTIAESGYTFSAGSVLSAGELMDFVGSIHLGADRITEYSVSDAANNAFCYVISFTVGL